MKPRFIRFLRCPETGRPLRLIQGSLYYGRIKDGTLFEPRSGRRYPIVNFIPRFVSKNNYASSFGFEWNTHTKTQYDETSAHSVSGDRFAKETRWKSSLNGEMMLEIGCGSGRFTKEALKTGATVVSFDYSTAVDANYASNGTADNLLVVQADMYAMPFPKHFFDKAFCFGVLQHTYNPELAFLRIPPYIKPGGELVSDIYVKSLTRWVLQPKYWVRPFTKRRNPQVLYFWIKKYIDVMWPLAKQIRRIPYIGPSVNWKLLIADYSRELPRATDSVLKEWAYLDTFDMLSPMYDTPQTLTTFMRWHKKAGLTDIDIHYGYNGIEGRGTIPGRK